MIQKGIEKAFLMCKALSHRRMLGILFLGISSGLPLMLLAFTLKLWLKREGISLTALGYMSWVLLFYSLKFLFCPFLDRFSILPQLGRRRSWMLLTQVGLIASLASFSLFQNPAQELPQIVMIALLAAFFSSLQDATIDAYRRDILPDAELGLGSSLAVYGYRIGMWVATGIGTMLVDPHTLNLTFQQLYLIMAGLMLIGPITCLFCPIPDSDKAHLRKIKKERGEKFAVQFKNFFVQNVYTPFLDFLSKEKAVVVLLFIFLFKLGDSFGGSMLSAFYVDTQYSNFQIGSITKTFGLLSTFLGLLIGGSLIFYRGIRVTLWVSAFLQMFSTMSFILLNFYPGDNIALAFVVGFEDMSSGIGTAALVSLISILTNKNFSATQFALLTSFSTLGRNFFSGFAGSFAESWGYNWFFIFCGLLALPGIYLLRKIPHAYSKIPVSEKDKNQADPPSKS